MSAKDRKRAKKRRARNRPVDSRSVSRDELPRPLRLVLEGADQADRYLRGAADLDSVKAAALGDIRDAVDRIVAATSPYDGFDILENVRLSQTLNDPETYRETEHEGSTAVVEIAAAVLAARGTRQGTLPEVDGHRAGAERVMDSVLSDCRAIIDSGSVYIAVSSIGNSPEESMIRLGAVLREVFVRNLAYAHMVEDSLDGLFGDVAVESDCRTHLGCTVREVRAVFDSLKTMHAAAWESRFEALHELADIASREVGADQPGDDRDDHNLDADARHHARDLWVNAWANPADASVFAVSDIASTAGLAESVVSAVVDVFALELSARDPFGAVEELLDGRAGFRSRPILRDASGDFVVVHGALLTSSVRDRVEEVLRTTPAWDRYQKRRGAYLEDEALRLLARHLPGCTVLSGVEYFVPNPAASIPETNPASFTKLVEGDGLLIVDDVAVVVEAKAGSLSADSRTGDISRLHVDLGRIVTGAANQIDRTRQRILTDGGLKLGDRTWLDLSGVREVHGIAVSLDDLSGIATVTSHLVAEGLLPHDHLPWTVSLHDLRIIAELVARPAELLLYLRRRTEPDVTSRYHAVDELDFFLEFYATGLYVEPDPDRMQAELPQFGEPSVRDRRRFKAQGLEMLLSRTDQLDAWYMHQLGVRRTPAPKPTKNDVRAMRDQIDQLAQLGAPGWLRVGTWLLEFDAATQRSFSEYGQLLCDESRHDDRPHTVAAIGGTRASSSFVLIWSSRGTWETGPEAKTRLTRYLAAKKHQAQVAMGAALLYELVDGAAVIQATVYNNDPVAPDPDLDKLVAESGLSSLDRAPSNVKAELGRRRRRR